MNIKAAGYVRASHDDGSDNESLTITNQTKLVREYIESQQWELAGIYADDGISGTTFERPAFQSLLEDIKKGKVNCVVVKDLSRLGRHYIETGRYLEEIFPELGVRCIALGERYDSFSEENNDFIPFKNILNEWYAKDISRKIRASRKINARQGNFMGSVPPYGYKKSPEDKHVLVPDENTCEIVQKIFKQFAYGSSAREIADRLNKMNILSPREYYYSNVGRENPTYTIKAWGSATIIQILKNEVYIGNMVQGKRVVKSFKDKKRKCAPKDNWICVKGTHEALIDNSLWNDVQNRLRDNQRQRTSCNGSLSVFSGLCYCADCNSKMVYSTKKRRNGSVVEYYKCSGYNNYGSSYCSSHLVRADHILSIVKSELSYYAELALQDKEKLLETLNQISADEMKKSESQFQKEIGSLQVQLQKIKNHIRRLLEHQEEFSPSLFHTMLEDYNKQYLEIEEKIQETERRLSELQNRGDLVSEFVESLSHWNCSALLDRKSILKLVNKIVIGQKQKIDGVVTQEIKIDFSL